MGNRSLVEIAGSLSISSRNVLLPGRFLKLKRAHAELPFRCHGPSFVTTACIVPPPYNNPPNVVSLFYIGGTLSSKCYLKQLGSQQPFLKRCHSTARQVPHACLLLLPVALFHQAHGLGQLHDHQGHQNQPQAAEVKPGGEGHHAKGDAHRGEQHQAHQHHRQQRGPV